MVNILHVYKTYFPDEPGGVQEAIRSICQFTRKYGYHHTVFTLSEDINPKEINYEGVKVFRERKIMDPLSCPIGSLTSFFKLKKLAQNADLILYHYPWPFGDLLSFGIRKKPYIIVYHSDIVKQKISRAFYTPIRNIFFKRASVIVSSSWNYAESSLVLQKYYNKLKVIPLTSIPESAQSDQSIIHKYNLSITKFVLFVGVLRYYKGLEVLIRAAKSINFPIVIAGDGPEKKRLEDLKNKLCAKNVFIVGRITNEQKKALFQKAAVFAFPSCFRSEAFGISLAEAAMYGVPMVSCEIGTGSSFINLDGQTGFVVPPNNVDLFSQAVNLILSSPMLAERMSAAAVSRWKEYLSPEIFGQAWNDLFTQQIRKN